MTLKVGWTQLLKENHGPELFSYAKKEAHSPLTFSVKKDQTLSSLKPLIAEKTGIPEEKQRLWSLSKRKNGTIRPDECLSGRESLVGRLPSSNIINHSL